MPIKNLYFKSALHFKMRAKAVLSLWFRHGMNPSPPPGSLFCGSARQKITHNTLQLESQTEKTRVSPGAPAQCIGPSPNPLLLASQSQVHYCAD